MRAAAGSGGSGVTVGVSSKERKIDEVESDDDGDSQFRIQQDSATRHILSRAPTQTPAHTHSEMLHSDEAFIDDTNDGSYYDEDDDLSVSEHSVELELQQQQQLEESPSKKSKKITSDSPMLCTGDKIRELVSQLTSSDVKVQKKVLSKLSKLAQSGSTSQECEEIVSRFLPSGAVDAMMDVFFQNDEGSASAEVCMFVNSS